MDTLQPYKLTSSSFVDYESDEFHDHHCILYAQMLFVAIKALQDRPAAPLVYILNQSCLSEGMTQFCSQPSYRLHFNTLAWRVFAVATSQKFQSSLASFLSIWLRHLCACLAVDTASTGPPPTLLFHFRAAASEYFSSLPDVFSGQDIAQLLDDCLTVPPTLASEQPPENPGVGMLKYTYGAPDTCHLPVRTLFAAD